MQLHAVWVNSLCLAASAAALDVCTVADARQCSGTHARILEHHAPLTFATTNEHCFLHLCVLTVDFSRDYSVLGGVMCTSARRTNRLSLGLFAGIGREVLWSHSVHRLFFLEGKECASREID